MDSSKQRLVRMLTIVGGSLTLLGVMAYFMMLAGGAAAMAKRGDPNMFAFAGLPLVVSLIGCAMAAAGLWIGFRHTFKNDSASPVQAVEGAYIIACVATNKTGDPVFDRDMYDRSELQYYVQVRLPDDSRSEYKTSADVFESLGEGLTGTAIIQGKWLGQFQTNRP
jgi:hypothetical protein